MLYTEPEVMFIAAVFVYTLFKIIILQISDPATMSKADYLLQAIKVTPEDSSVDEKS